MASLIVPSHYARNKPNRRAVTNVFARIVHNRKSGQRRYRGPVWKGVAPNAGGMTEHPGRPMGRPVGTWVDDLVQLRKTLVFCELCQHRFSERNASYYKDTRYGNCVHSKCDGCKEHTARGRLYLPEERLVEFSGMSKPGQVWHPA